MLKAILESLDETDTALHGFYKQQKMQVGGVEKDVFVLQIEGVNDHPMVKALKNAHEAQKAKNADLNTKLTAADAKLKDLPDDFSPEQFTELQSEIAGLRAKLDPNNPDHKRQEAEQQRLRELFETNKRTLEAKHAAALVAKDKEIQARDTEIARLAVGQGLAQQLAAVGVKPEFMDAATALIEKSAKVTRDADGKTQAVVNTDLGEVPLAEYVKTWAEGPMGKAMVVPPKGGDGPGSDNRRIANNPWATKDAKGNAVTPNLTAQGELVKEATASGNWSKIRNLMSAAGLSEAEITRKTSGRAAA